MAVTYKCRVNCPNCDTLVITVPDRFEGVLPTGTICPKCSVRLAWHAEDQHLVAFVPHVRHERFSLREVQRPTLEQADVDFWLELDGAATGFGYKFNGGIDPTTWTSRYQNTKKEVLAFIVKLNEMVKTHEAVPEQSETEIRIRIEELSDADRVHRCD